MILTPLRQFKHLQPHEHTALTSQPTNSRRTYIISLSILQMRNRRLREVESFALNPPAGEGLSPRAACFLQKETELGSGAGVGGGQ